jgi:hypothetical protein
MNYDIKAWVILLCLGIIFLIICILSMLPAKTKNHPFADYTSDIIIGDKWAWTWNGYSGSIDDIRMVCPEDDTDMVSIGDLGGKICGYECPRCKYKKDISRNDIVRVQAIICDNIKRKLRSKKSNK